MQDLSPLAEGSMWPTSQAGGNMMSGRQRAMSAPGSPPTDPLPAATDQGEPAVVPSDTLTRADSGKPQPRTVSGDWSPGAPAWRPAAAPGVVTAVHVIPE